MSEKRRKQVVFAVLVLAVVWGIYNQPWKRHQPPASQPAGPAPTEAQNAPEPIQAGMVHAGKNPAHATLVSEWAVDPFHGGTPAVKEKTKTPAAEPLRVPVLQGTMLVGNKPVCVIGGKTYASGDRVSEWQVLSIAAGRVEIVRVSDGKRVSLGTGENKGTRRR